MRVRTIVAPATLALLPLLAHAGSLDLGYGGAGLSLGNSPRWNGLRVNGSDRNVEEIRGLNLTLWKPDENPDARLRGLACGIVAPAGRRIEGIGLGLIAVAADEAIAGLSFAGVGIGTSSLAGIGVAGIGLGADRITGIGVGGVGIGANRFDGIGIGGAGIGADRARGIVIGGVGVGASRIDGLAVGGIGVGADLLRGAAIGGVGLGGGTGRGLLVGGLYTRFGSHDGLALGAVCRIDQRMRGASIGGVNIAGSLHGVQIGLINWAANNPWYARCLPGLNLHLGAPAPDSGRAVEPDR